MGDFDDGVRETGASLRSSRNHQPIKLEEDANNFVPSLRQLRELDTALTRYLIKNNIVTQSFFAYGKRTRPTG